VPADTCGHGWRRRLIPTPSSDPNDPLNWSKPFKLYITALACSAVFMADFGSAASTVAIVQMAIDFTGLPPNISRTALFFSVSFLFLGSGMFVWNPLLTKFGKRPVYLVSFSFFFLATVWSALATSYGSQMASRVFIGFMGGAAECLAPLTITDLFFVHERGTYLGVFQAFLSCGVAAGSKSTRFSPAKRQVAELLTLELFFRYSCDCRSG
jgi:MFS family permease